MFAIDCRLSTTLSRHGPLEVIAFNFIIFYLACFFASHLFLFFLFFIYSFLFLLTSLLCMYKCNWHQRDYKAAPSISPLLWQPYNNSHTFLTIHQSVSPNVIHLLIYSFIWTNKIMLLLLLLLLVFVQLSWGLLSTKGS